MALTVLFMCGCQFALESDTKWALSGTPMQNSVGELYSLVRFLRYVSVAGMSTGSSQCAYVIMLPLIGSVCVLLLSEMRLQELALDIPRWPQL